MAQAISGQVAAFVSMRLQIINWCLVGVQDFSLGFLLGSFNAMGVGTSLDSSILNFTKIIKI
jgi:hypothetical protein